ncbi:hypothetical protein [Rhizobium sp. BK491]|uniref:hypothetical protein n=1 Tax=Rhizobium sp. BK491 TaxID=2587009 RepID=UPI00161C6B63|nr:hypothetical protein [Rhizobium sp. BK491]MBB3567593.1 hypothetical protein [Rhizobium sp. BK491]
MVELDSNTMRKLHKLLPLLASGHAGEVAATAAAIVRTLHSAGACLHDLAAMIEKPPRVVEKVVYRDRVVVEEKIVYRDRPAHPVEQSHSDHSSPSAARVIEVGRGLLASGSLTDKQRGFVENIVACAENDGERFAMTPRQCVWLDGLAAQHLGSAAHA